MAASLSDKLASIRELKSRGANFEVQAMYEILALEKQRVLWQSADTTNFAILLKDQPGICPPSKFRSFKKATEYFQRSTIDKLGVPCVCLLAQQSAATRERLIKHALTYRKDHGAEPTYQFFSRYLRKPGAPVSRKRLLKYIEVLKKEIRDRGGRVPVME